MAWAYLVLLLGYGGLLVLLGRIGGKGTPSLAGFFTANRQAPWAVVAIGMVGTSLSGVTYLSVPGAVGTTHLTYLQVVLGYLVGYGVIATVLLPLYYRLELTSIYGYLEARYGVRSRQTGAVFFLAARSLGAAARLYLAALVLQEMVFQPLGVPFALTSAFVLAIILVYSARGGLRTIVWTDLFQTLFMLGAGLAAAVALANGLAGPGVFASIQASPLSQVFVTHGWAHPHHWAKDLLSGALIAIVMTGLDQDMMQKNLSIRTLGNAQRNMALYSVVLVGVNVLFLGLGVLLYLTVAQHGLDAPTGDALFGYLATQHLAPWVGVVFVLGLAAATYSSADGTLAALTTSAYLDILRRPISNTPADRRLKNRLYAGFVGLFWLLLMGFAAYREASDFNVIRLVLSLAGYTYGPLLGLYTYGLLSRRTVPDGSVPVVALLATATTVGAVQTEFFGLNYVFGFEHIALNGGLTALLLAVVARVGPRRAVRPPK